MVVSVTSLPFVVVPPLTCRNAIFAHDSRNKRVRTVEPECHRSLTEPAVVEGANGIELLIG